MTAALLCRRCGGDRGPARSDRQPLCKPCRNLLRVARAGNLSVTAARAVIEGRDARRGEIGRRNAEILAAIRSKAGTYAAIADRFGVSRRTVEAVWRREKERLEEENAERGLAFTQARA